MSPTVLLVGGYRFFFYSREERRAHVHVQHGAGEAKIWLEPKVELASVAGLSARRVRRAIHLVEAHHETIRAAWAEHFAG